MQLPILYQDPHLVVVNKPAGLLVHRSTIDRRATEFALQRVRDQLGQHVYPVHRLDRATSGALMFALTQEMARAMTETFARGAVEKTYWAIVRGVLREPLILDYPLREELDAISDARADQNKAAQNAVTHFVPLATCELAVQVDRYATSRYSLVQALPKTGRKHQIRRHLHHLHHPIIGDVNYGSGKHNRFFATELACKRLLLACVGVAFDHPILGKRLTVAAPLAEDFSAIMTRLGWAEYLHAKG